jgi:radical SAM family uncharacterized protein
MHEFIDLFVIGEAEEAAVELMNVYRAHKQAYRAGRMSKDDLLHAFAQVEGVYVPHFYDAVYSDDGSIRFFSANRQGVPAAVKKRILKDMNVSALPREWLVPYIQIIHDRLTLEISRGCPNHCRFCQARSCYYPVRYRSQKNVLDAAKQYYCQTGYDEISLAGLSVSDYPDLPGLLGQMISEFKDKGVSLSLPSIKPKSFLGGASTLIATVKKTGLTFAPEAATPGLREVIGKDFDEAEFFSMLDEVYKSGYLHVKLYFMIGLPRETAADIEAIAFFSSRVSQARKAAVGSSAQVNVSVNTVIPKPHTPFQWVRMLTIDEMQAAQRLLLSKVNSRKIKMSFHDRSMTFLEGVFSRGDRRLSPVIKAAYSKGCRFDGWDEHFKFSAWEEAFRDAAVDPAVYLRERGIDERMPWDFIDVGISKKALIEEYWVMKTGCHT